MLADDPEEPPFRETNERSWVVATRVTLAIAGVILVVLIVTGVMLSTGYRPNVTQAYVLGHSGAPHQLTRTVHRTAAWMLLFASGVVALTSVGLAIARNRVARVIVPMAAGVAVLAATITGFLLPWDQLALFRVSVGTNIRGYHEILFTHDVKYVLIGDQEIGTSTFARWFWIHSVGLTLLLVVLLAVIALHTRATKPRAEE